MLAPVIVDFTRRAVETFGPVLLRELAKPRTRRFIEEKVRDIKKDIGVRRATTGKSKKFIIRRGRQSFQCVRMN